MIDWNTEDNHFCLNPRLPPKEQEHLLGILKITTDLKAHIWVTTSGTSAVGSLKWVALSKKAILTSAEAVNKHLKSTSSDVWINPLPEFHAGGIGISARAFLSGAKEINFKELCPKWDAPTFYDTIIAHKGTLSALVPAQVYDLVTLGLQAPEALRGIIVGGGVLENNLYQQGIALGWPLLPSYGLTECASQVATASLGSSELIPLNHVKVEINEDQLIRIRSESLLTGYGIFQAGKWSFIDPKREGWFVTEDKGFFNGQFLKVLGRHSHFIKIGGESTNVQRLESILEAIKLELKIQDDVALISMPDYRLGHVIHLAITEEKEHMRILIDKFHEHVLPFERIRKIHQVKEIPRSPLKKLLKQKLLVALLD